jgi:Tat protein secretion system quality control protein TatD with DNase activity
MTAPELVDVHSHIHGDDFDEDRTHVLEQAARAGVRCVLAMGEGYADNQRVLEVASQHTRTGPRQSRWSR